MVAEVLPLRCLAPTPESPLRDGPPAGFRGALRTYSPKAMAWSITEPEKHPAEVGGGHVGGLGEEGRQGPLTWALSGSFTTSARAAGEQGGLAWSFGDKALAPCQPARLCPARAAGQGREHLLGGRRHL